MTTLYAVCPGFVTSKYDGQRHYVSARELITLYGVRPHQCIVFEDWVLPTGRQRFREKMMADMIKLTPRSDGNYRLPGK